MLFLGFPTGANARKGLVPVTSAVQTPAQVDRPPHPRALARRPSCAPSAGPSRTERGGHARMESGAERHGVDPVQSGLSHHGIRLRPAVDGQPFHLGDGPVEHRDAHVDACPPPAGLRPVTELPPTVQRELEFLHQIPRHRQGDGVELDAQFIGALDPLFQFAGPIARNRVKAVVQVLDIVGKSNKGNLYLVTVDHHLLVAKHVTRSYTKVLKIDHQKGT